MPDILASVSGPDVQVAWVTGPARAHSAEFSWRAPRVSCWRRTGPPRSCRQRKPCGSPVGPRSGCPGRPVRSAWCTGHPPAVAHRRQGAHIRVGIGGRRGQLAGFQAGTCFLLHARALDGDRSMQLTVAAVCRMPVEFWHGGVGRVARESAWPWHQGPSHVL